MTILTRKHTTVIDLDAETITEIDYSKKTYSVIPFAQWKKVLDDAEAQSPRETGFKVSTRPPGSNPKPIGIVNAAESVMDIAGAGGSLNISVDAWVGTIPGYEQMQDFTARLAGKLTWGFAAGIAPLALHMPESLQGFDEAAKQLNESRGVPLEATVRVSHADQGIAQATIELSKFGGGIQDASKFTPPEGFKKVDPALPLH